MVRELSVDDLTVLVGVGSHILGVLVHGAEAHTHGGETAIVEEVLHRHLAGEVAEEHHAVVGAFFGRGVAQRRHLVGEVHHIVDVLDALTCCGGRGRLRDGVDTYVLLAAVDVAEGACNAFEHALGVGHIVVTEECALAGHVGQGHHATALSDSVLLLGHLQHLVEGDGRDVEGLLQIAVVQVVVGAVLAHVGAHTDGVEHEVNLAAEFFNALFEHLLEVFHAGCVSGNNGCVEFLGEFVEFAHTQGHGGIAQGDDCTFFDSLLGYFPCDRLGIEGTEDDAALAFQ